MWTEFPTSKEDWLRKLLHNSVRHKKKTTGIVTPRETNRLINRLNSPPNNGVEENEISALELYPQNFYVTPTQVAINEHNLHLNELRESNLHLIDRIVYHGAFDDNHPTAKAVQVQYRVRCFGYEPEDDTW